MSTIAPTDIRWIVAGVGPTDKVGQVVPLNPALQAAVASALSAQAAAKPPVAVPQAVPVSDPWQYGAGWTSLPLAPGARVFYVSNSGEDSAPGGQDAPLKSIPVALAQMRSGTGDRICLRRGDTFAMTGPVVWRYSGAPGGYAGLFSWGSGPRPVVVVPADGVNAQTLPMSRVAFHGIHFKAANKWTPDACAFDLRNRHQQILIEDCRATQFETGIAMHEPGEPATQTMSGIVFRRNVIEDTFSTVNAQGGQGIYIGNTAGTLIEQNLFYKCGWGDGVHFDMFRHGLYGQWTNAGLSLLNNVFAHCCSYAAEVRCTGTVSGNVGHDTAMGFLLGHDGDMTNNLVYAGHFHTVSVTSGQGGFQFGGGKGNFTGNLYVPGPAGDPKAMAPDFLVGLVNKAEAWAYQGPQTPVVSGNRKISGTPPTEAWLQQAILNTRTMMGSDTLSATALISSATIAGK